MTILGNLRISNEASLIEGRYKLREVGLALGARPIHAARLAAGGSELFRMLLRELAGVLTPFTESVRERLDGELRTAHGEELARLREEYEGRLAALERDQLSLQADRLRRRLLQLAGYGEGAAR